VYSKVCYRIPPEHKTFFSKTADDVLSLEKPMDKELTEFSKLFQKNDQGQKGSRTRIAELLTDNFKLKKRVEEHETEEMDDSSQEVIPSDSRPSDQGATGKSRQELDDSLKSSQEVEQIPCDQDAAGTRDSRMNTYLFNSYNLYNVGSYPIFMYWRLFVNKVFFFSD